MYKKLLIATIILVLILSACSQNSDQRQNSPDPNDIKAPEDNAQNEPAQNNPNVEPPQPESAEPAQPAESAITNIILGSPVPTDQQYRLVKADAALWLINREGSRVIEVRLPAILQDYQSLDIQVSPSSDWVAIHAATQANVSALFLWSPVYGTLDKITNLFNGCSPNQEQELCEDVWRATGQMAWSHDSSQLAFTSAHLGDSSDLYVFDVASWDIRWLTDGPAQAVMPSWSLDDAYILHAAVDRLYYGFSGSGYEGWQYYSSEPDGSKNHTLAAGSGEDRVDQEYLGWVSDHEMLLHSGYWFCGNFDLRMINAVIDEEHIFWHGNYHGAAYNPEMGAALVYVDPSANEIPECGPIDKEPGLYLVTIPGNKQTLLDVDPGSVYGYEMVTGEGYGVIFVQSGEGWLGVSADGRTEFFAGNPYLPREYWELELDIDEIYGWVSLGG